MGKSKVRIAGEVITLINNIVISLGIIGVVIYLYLLEPVLKTITYDTLGLEYYNNYTYYIHNAFRILNDNKLLIISMAIVIILLIWVFRTIVITRNGKIMSKIAIVLNITNILGIIGYAFILYDNIQLHNNELLKDTDEISRFNSNKFIKIGIILIALASIIMTIIILKMGILNKNNNESNLEEKQNINNIENEGNTLDSITGENIRLDYKKKMKDLENIAVQRDGIYRYNKLGIDNLRKYDVSKLENAKIVYELSDEILNGTYQGFKNDMTEEAFAELRDNQRIWLSDKLEYESNTKDNELIKYQKLINMTLDRCEEWNENYNN